MNQDARLLVRLTDDEGSVGTKLKSWFARPARKGGSSASGVRARLPQVGETDTGESFVATGKDAVVRSMTMGTECRVIE